MQENLNSSAISSNTKRMTTRSMRKRGEQSSVISEVPLKRKIPKFLEIEESKIHERKALSPRKNKENLKPKVEDSAYNAKLLEISSLQQREKQVSSESESAEKSPFFQNLLADSDQSSNKVKVDLPTFNIPREPL